MFKYIFINVLSFVILRALTHDVHGRFKFGSAV
jgi:hypothetical protein